MHNFYNILNYVNSPCGKIGKDRHMRFINKHLVVRGYFQTDKNKWTSVFSAADVTYSLKYLGLNIPLGARFVRFVQLLINNFSC